MATEPWWQKLTLPPGNGFGDTLVPQKLNIPPSWIVVGGMESGGLIVREGRELSSTQVDDRLCTGAIIQELALVGERLHFQKLEGDGPEEGWVSTKVKGKEVLTHSPIQYSAAWIVVGGSENGILVRQGRELASTPLDLRLQTGAVVQELELVGERLHFHRLTGLGPEHGWISIRMKGKALLVRSKRAYGPPHPTRNPMGGCGVLPVLALGAVTVVRGASTFEEPQPPRIDNDKMRVLCLCGGGSCSAIMKFQTAMMRGLLKDQAEFDYLEGDVDYVDDQHTPRHVYPLQETIRKGAPNKLWFRHTFAETDMHLGWTERELYFQPDAKVTYENAHEVISRFRKYVDDKGPFDVVLGFSFGANVLTLVTGAILHEGGTLPWRLNLMFNGHHVRDAAYQEFFSAPLTCPAVMVCSTNDHYREYEHAVQTDGTYSIEGSKLLQAYCNPTIITHDGAHDLPTAPPQAPQVYAEVIAAMRWYCGLPAKKT